MHPQLFFFVITLVERGGGRCMRKARVIIAYVCNQDSLEITRTHTNKRLEVRARINHDTFKGGPHDQQRVRR